MECKPVCLLYTRKSWVKKQDSNDPANSQVRQADMSSAVCRARGWEVEVFSEPEGHRSGANEEKRPGFQALKARLLREPKPIAVVVWRLDRLSRSKKDIFNFLSDLQKMGVDFITATGNIDTTTAFGRAFLGFQAVMGELERELTGERRVDELLYKQSHGYHVGTVPLGYDRVKCVLQPNGQATTVRYILQSYLTGTYSYNSLTRHVNAVGLRTAKGAAFCRESVRAVIENAPLYAGFIDRRTDYMKAAGQPLERYEGQHRANALITEDEARRIQEIRLRRQARNLGMRETAYCYILTPVLYCAGCGKKMGGFHHFGRLYHHLKEGCPAPAYVSADRLEHQLVDHLKAHAVPRDLEKEIEGHLERLNGRQADQGDVARIVAGLERRRERAKRLYLMGELDDDGLGAELRGINDELARYLPEPIAVTPLDMSKVKDIGHILEAATWERQKELIFTLYERLETDGRQIVLAVPRPWALAVFGPRLAI